MGAWIRGSVLTMLTFGAFWGGAIWTWRSTGRAPSTSDLVTYLVALPLVVLAGVLLVRRVARAQPASVPAAAAAPAVAVPAAVARLPALALVDAAVRTRHGDSVDDLAAALTAHRARPDLDPELVDDAGYPVMTVRVPSAGDAAWRAEAEPWLVAQGHADVGFGDAHWRALELASAIASELADAAALAAVDDPLLRIVPLAPADWTAVQRTAAGAWLAHVATRAGWAADKVAVSPAPPGEPAAAASALLSVLAGQTDDDAALTILLAFDSRIDQAVVDRMSAEGTLFIAAHPQGLVPGEGAAGLLLAATADAAPTLQAASTTRAASADAAPRVDAADLRRLAQRVLAETAVDTFTVSALIADADHRSSRVLEAMALAHDDLPHLDAGIDVSTTGPACGQSGAVPFLAALALARRHALDGTGAVLCVGNADPVHRSVAVVRPAAATVSATVSATA
ncbi:hypothetical protein SAMN05428966_105154 [Massilia sp. PDC64]|nr:hypothetical protein [Massilia sp. PDC64]SDD68188.1 hypothetical protein SAMN05428966_105154 [Massilia sp. PDC64]